MYCVLRHTLGLPRMHVVHQLVLQQFDGICMVLFPARFREGERNEDLGGQGEFEAFGELGEEVGEALGGESGQGDLLKEII